jgi:uncharacterized protein (TIGR02145 family)
MKKLTIFCPLFFICLSVYSQDYLINFAGTGSSTTIDSVTVENLTRGTSLTLNGTDILNLEAEVTDLNEMYENSEKTLKVYPNPATEYTSVEFIATALGNALLAIYDQVGKVITQNRTNLAKGTHMYQINGLQNGIYTIRVTSDAYSYTGKIISQQKDNTSAIIIYKSFTNNTKTKNRIKSINASHTMPYTLGDRLIFTSYSGNYITITTDIPTVDKTITFEFIACTDADGNNYPVVKICDKVWMAQNLRTTRYVDGNIIPSTIPATLEIRDSIQPKYQWTFPTVVEMPGIQGGPGVYGRLYTWDALRAHSGVCPVGWHVPQDYEWYQFQDSMIAYGYNYDGTTTDNKIGKALASTISVPSGWIQDFTYPGSIGNSNFSSYRNKSGFSALPCGSRGGDGSFRYFGLSAYWWCGNETYENLPPNYDRPRAWSVALHNYYYGLDIGNALGKCIGLSVRCMKNNVPGGGGEE